MSYDDVAEFDSVIWIPQRCEHPTLGGAHVVAGRGRIVLHNAVIEAANHNFCATQFKLLGKVHDVTGPSFMAWPHAYSNYRCFFFPASGQQETDQNNGYQVDN